jgi:hypothetical protein
MKKSSRTKHRLLDKKPARIRNQPELERSVRYAKCVEGVPLQSPCSLLVSTAAGRNDEDRDDRVIDERKRKRIRIRLGSTCHIRNRVGSFVFRRSGCFIICSGSRRSDAARADVR